MGGEIFYKFIASNQEENSNIYEINLVYYQLITATSTTVSTQIVEVFKGSEPFSVIENSNLPVIPMELVSFDTLPKVDFPCFLTEEYIVAKSAFKFEIELPVSDSSYYFSFGNCCRSISDNVLGLFETNEVIPTYFLVYTEITPLAQQLQTNSPVLGEYNLPILCINQNVEVSIAPDSTSSEGQLIYDLYNPFAFNNANSGDPPPFLQVPYQVPTYTYNQPFGQGVNLNLNPNTGLLNFTPDHTGKFLVGMAVKEYRNGELLSTTFRDFQVVVSDCTPKIDAQVLADTILENGDFVINICDTDSYTIQNRSTQTEYIQNYTWNIEGLSNNNLSEWNPMLTFSEGGRYKGQLFLNQNEECSDTATIVLNVTTNIDANFDLSYDTCVGGSVAFESQSFSEGGEITNLFWEFGDDDSSTEIAPQHLYEAPGTYIVNLTIENEFGCLDSSFVQFDWLPVPPIIVVAPSTFEGCSPLDVSFENLSSPIDSTYTIVWEFGDGVESSAIHSAHTYTEPETYSLYVSITSPIGCSIDTLFPDWIQVELPPIAGFSFSPSSVSSLNPTVIFQDESERATAWFWDFDKENIAYSETFSHTFVDTGFQNVTLLVEDEYGCTDSLTQVVDIIPEVTYYLPNAFTPNGDGKNDVFKGKGVLDGIKSFNMVIWNRWGEKVFETNSPNEGWKGRFLNTGKEIPAGVYVLSLTYLAPRGEIITKREHITLIR